MELVRGIPITKYCDENHLTPTARLELFIQVCHAVQHAHQKGIIHRDLKPSNLVTVNDGAPTPKIIDFGIAKATQGRLTDATVFTAFEQFIGTPVYMSPEQAEMSSLDIDTRSDIYSLGVLLYELLSGRPPFDPTKFAQAGVDQIRQQIREIEPLRPSARLRTLTDEEQTTIARLRATAPSQLSLNVRGRSLMSRGRSWRRRTSWRRTIVSGVGCSSAPPAGCGPRPRPAVTSRATSAKCSSLASSSNSPRYPRARMP
jgi:eukaryotic-like serine/threonine-protein kinase